MRFLTADRHFERFEDVTPEILKAESVKLLLCDLDNTLKVRRDTEPEEELVKWVEVCKKAGVKIVVISNNGKKRKIQAFCRPLGIDCVWWAKKPMSTKLTEAMTKYGFDKVETVMLGDKWSTDVLAAKFAGVRAWKVEHRKGILSDFEKQEKKVAFRAYKISKKELKNDKKA